MPSKPPSFSARLRVRNGTARTDPHAYRRRKANPSQAAVDKLRLCTRWRKLRASVLRGEPLCRMCVAEGVTREATQVDHIVPLRDRPDLAYRKSNCQPLCRLHHQRKSNQERRRG